MKDHGKSAMQGQAPDLLEVLRPGDPVRVSLWREHRSLLVNRDGAAVFVGWQEEREDFAKVVARLSSGWVEFPYVHRSFLERVDD